MPRSISEEIAAMCLQWHELQRDGFEREATELRERIQQLSDRVMLLARQRNESVQECGVS